MPSIFARTCQKCTCKAQVDAETALMKCLCGKLKYNFFSTCPLLKTINNVTHFMKFLIYMCSTKCLIKNAKEYSCGAGESKNYMSIFFAVWDWIKDHWNLEFGFNCSQDESVFGRVGHPKYGKGALKQLPRCNADKVIDCDPSAKNQYRRYSKVTKTESCYENFQADLYLPVPEGIALFFLTLMANQYVQLFFMYFSRC